jgi:hypothetical protein
VEVLEALERQIEYCHSSAGADVGKRTLLPNAKASGLRKGRSKHPHEVGGQTELSLALDTIKIRNKSGDTRAGGMRRPVDAKAAADQRKEAAESGEEKPTNEHVLVLATNQ